MKKNSFWARLLTAILMLVSFGMLLTTPASLKVNNFHGLVKHVINREIKAQGSEDLNEALSLFKQTGAEDQLLTGLPKRVHYEMSYASLYELSANKENVEKQFADEAVAPLKQVPFLEKYARRYVKKAMRSEQVTQLNSYLDQYKTYFLAACAVFAVCVLLVLFGHTTGVWLGLLLTAGCYGLLAVVAQQLAASLQTSVYPGIEVTLGSNCTLAVLIMVIALIVWQIGRHFAKRRVKR